MRRIAHINRADCDSSLPVHTGDRHHRRRVRKAGVSRRGTGIRINHHRRSGFGNAVVNRAADIVVVGAAREGPLVARVDAGGGVYRVGYVDGANGSSCLAVHTADRVSRRVRKPGIGRGRTGVRRDHHRRLCLGNMPGAARRRRQHIVARQCPSTRCEVAP